MKYIAVTALLYFNYWMISNNIQYWGWVLFFSLIITAGALNNNEK